jgi:hypothetical protein
MLDRIVALPVGVTARALGPMPMQGKGLSVELYALEATAHRIGASDIDLHLRPAVGE